MKFVLKLAVTAGAIWLAVWIVDGLEFDGGFWAFVGVSLFLLLANAIVKPILNVLSFPLILVTLGLFLLITNALVLQLTIWLSGDFLTSTGFFWATFLGALVISVVRWAADAVLDDD